MSSSPLNYTVRRVGVELSIRVTCRHLRLWLLLKDKEGGWTDSRLWYRFEADSRGRSLEEAKYFAKVLGFVIEKGGSAQFSLGGKPCAVWNDGRNRETPVVLEIGAIDPVAIPLRLTEARKIHAYFRDYYDLTA